jgi:tetratricopeptide (TPR) repeat protein
VIEYIEWVHALQGPEAALEAISDLRAKFGQDLSFSYFEAYFHAESGDLETARRLGETFAARISDESSPQPHYLRAYIAFTAGDLEGAAAYVDRALELDPRHLIAERLHNEIEAAR